MLIVHYIGVTGRFFFVHCLLVSLIAVFMSCHCCMRIVRDRNRKARGSHDFQFSLYLVKLLLVCRSKSHFLWNLLPIVRLNKGAVKKNCTNSHKLFLWLLVQLFSPPPSSIPLRRLHQGFPILLLVRYYLKTFAYASSTICRYVKFPLANFHEKHWQKSRDSLHQHFSTSKNLKTLTIKRSRSNRKCLVWHFLSDSISGWKKKMKM